MKRERNDFFMLILGFIIVVVGLAFYFTNRIEKRKDFENLLKSEMYLEADLGIVQRERKLKEKVVLPQLPF